VQHRIRSLSKAFLLQAGLGVAFGVCVFLRIFGVPYMEVAAGVLFAVSLISTVALEFGRDYVRQSLRLEKSASELAAE
jgi:hypothetical protein